MGMPSAACHRWYGVSARTQRRSVVVWLASMFSPPSNNGLAMVVNNAGCVPEILPIRPPRGNSLDAHDSGTVAHLDPDAVGVRAVDGPFHRLAEQLASPALPAADTPAPSRWGGARARSARRAGRT